MTPAHHDVEVSAFLHGKGVRALAGEEEFLSVESCVVMEAVYGTDGFMFSRSHLLDISNWGCLVSLFFIGTSISSESAFAHAHVWDDTLTSVQTRFLTDGCKGGQKYICFIHRSWWLLISNSVRIVWKLWTNQRAVYNLKRCWCKSSHNRWV